MRSEDPRDSENGDPDERSHYQRLLDAERERIAKTGADFFQNGDFDTWESPTGRVFDDLGNGWQVGYDMMRHIIGAGLMKRKPDDIPVCPDCVQGKHTNCTGSWNNTKDEPAACPCDLRYHKVGK